MLFQSVDLAPSTTDRAVGLPDITCIINTFSHATPLQASKPSTIWYWQLTAKTNAFSYNARHSSDKAIVDSRLHLR